MASFPQASPTTPFAHLYISGQRYAPVAFSPGKNPGTHLLGGWLGYRAVLGILDRRKSLSAAGIQTRNVQGVA